MIKNLNKKEILRLLEDNYIGRLAFVSGECPFVIPITYFFDAEEKSIISYSAVGHKIKAMRKNDSVCLQVDQIVSIMNWKSIVIHGNYEELKGSTAKKYLHRFAEGVKRTFVRKEGAEPQFIGDFSSRLDERGLPVVYRIKISEIEGKYRDGR